VFVVLIFLVLVGGVLAMDGPIRVLTDSGNRVSVFVYPSGGGSLLNNGGGVADGDGVFVTDTFFSLNAPYKLSVIILDSNFEASTFEEEVTGLGFGNGVDVDCRSGNCIVSASEVVEVVDEVEVVVEEVVVEEVVVNESVDVSEDVGNESGGILLTGKALFFNDDGSVNWVYSVGGVVFFFLFLIFISVMFRRGRSKKIVLGNDEKELEDVEVKVKETADKIQNFKDGKMRRNKIYKAKVKLAEEEKELSELLEKGRNSPGRVEAQKKDIEEAKGDVDEVKG